jgi:hypothetical protein
LDEEIDTEEGVTPFGLRMKRSSKEEIPCIEEKDVPPLLSYLGNQSRFLGDTTKRISESPTRLDFTHHIIGVDNAELSFGCP